MIMDSKEKMIKLWFDMWLQKRDLGIMDMFDKEAVYIESWGPEYTGAEKIRHWFAEWNTRGSVLVWDIKQFFHNENQTVVEWHFENSMDDGTVQAFDGISLIKWSQSGKICFLKEFGCNIHNYDPYQGGAEPHFQDTGAKSMWF